MPLQANRPVPSNASTPHAFSPRIPKGARVVIRVAEGADPATGRMGYQDYVGHVLQSSPTAIDLSRDAAANGSRPEQRVHVPISSIVALKPVPERPRRARPHAH